MTLLKKKDRATLTTSKNREERPKTKIDSNMGLEKILKANDRILKILK
ncbi:hypothetical protein [Paenibacillus illinoisensis]